MSEQPPSFSLICLSVSVGRLMRHLGLRGARRGKSMRTTVPDIAVSAGSCEPAVEIFTLDEVAAYLKVGKRTVYRLAAAKKIPAFKVGGTWRFRRQEIDQWIKRQTAEAQGGDVPGTSHGGNG